MPKLSLTLAPLFVALTAAMATAQDNPTEQVPHENAPELVPTDDDNGLFADPADTAEEGTDTPESKPETDPVDAPDLPMNDPIAVDPEVQTYRFATESAGMLTLMAQAPGASVAFEIQNAQGRALPGNGTWPANTQNQQEAQQIGYSTLAFPIPEAGEYIIQLVVQGNDEDTINLCGVWIEFEQMGALPALGAIPVPGNPGIPPVEEPGDETPDLMLGETLEVEIEGNLGWARFTADEDGTLVVAGPSNNRPTLSACRDGNFANIDRWTNDQGILMFRVQADEVWYIKVQGNNDTVRLRSTLIPDDLDEHIPAEEDE